MQWPQSILWEGNYPRQWSTLGKDSETKFEMHAKKNPTKELVNKANISTVTYMKTLFQLLKSITVPSANTAHIKMLMPEVHEKEKEN